MSWSAETSWVLAARCHPEQPHPTSDRLAETLGFPHRDDGTEPRRTRLHSREPLDDFTRGTFRFDGNGLSPSWTRRALVDSAFTPQLNDQGVVAFNAFWTLAEGRSSSAPGDR
jgi:hypothetical protein